MHEINHEAKKLWSKSADIITTQTATNLKIAIEKMREQIPNVE